ncbi:integrase [Lactobacillus amylolyticus]|uniref:phage integrase SAM-like domain-containing protein n=1 Tax=Lactobacillus amylolyticus TaxID=83683 RepID=UPI0009BA1493|nr:phage integrase SAM-like domain-containing protein [Lactobacillus amylolyticus]ARD06177.1 integrase [Lactobacillus amylolyticus]
MIKKILKGEYKGLWSVRIQPTINGKRMRITKRAKTRLEAQKLEIDLKVKYAGYKNGLPSITDESNFLDEYTKYVEKKAQSITATTNRSCSYSLTLLNEYLKKKNELDIQLKDIDQHFFNDFAHWYIKDHPKASVKKSTVIDVSLAHFRTFFTFLLDKAVLNVNPIPRGYLKLFFKQSDFSTGRKWHLFSKDEVDALRKELLKEYEVSTVANSVSKLALLVDTYLGLRPEELQVLKFDQLVKYEGSYTFKIDNSWSEKEKKPNGSLKDRPKGAYRYSLPIKNNKIIDLIKEFQIKQKKYLNEYGLKNTSGYIFLNLHNYRSISSNNQLPVTQASLNDMLKAACSKSRIEKQKNSVLALYSLRVYLSSLLGNDNRISNMYACQRMGNTIQVFLSTYVKENRESYKQNSRLWSC